MEAIDKAGYEAGKQVRIALDVAATEFYDAEKKLYSIDGKQIDVAAMVGASVFENRYGRERCRSQPMISLRPLV